MAFYLSCVIIATAPVYFAAVQAWVWPFYAAAMMLTYILFRWQNRLNKAKTSRLWMLLGGIFFTWTLLQSVPLPAELIEKLSPFRYRALSDGATLAGIDFNPSSLSYNRFTSLGWWILLLSIAMFFIVLRNTLTDSRRLRLVLRIVLILAAFEALYGIIQALVPSVGVIWEDTIGLGNARGTYINRNHFAGFIEMVFPLCLGYTLSLGDWSGQKKMGGIKAMLSSDRSSPPLLLGVVLVIMLVAVLFSRSRAGIVGMGLGFLVFTLLVRLGSGRLPMGFLLGTIAIFGLTFVYGFRIGFESIIDRFLMISKGADRTMLWADAWRIVQDHPLGVGLANFSLVFPIYKVQTTHEAFYIYAHNDYLQLLIEAGWPGALALVGGFFIFIGMGFRRICKMSPRYDPLRFFLGAGALSGLVSIGFHSFFDFNLEMPANAIYFVLLMAIVCACTQRTEGRSRMSVVRSQTPEA
ncbi:hypothetical protein LCGC14_2106370 [marine sediment metagenome]|uniref:O-antigen ligase-related domain-containing protein n=1 Tax=marine sediment metagenome TaxID=412755 RepID=A0A0F9EVR6_9ZZZZ